MCVMTPDDLSGGPDRPPSVTQWKIVKGHGAEYEISNLGDVRSRKGRRAAPLRKWASKQGYQYVTMGDARRAVHHLVLEAFVGDRPSPRAETRHLDGNPRHNWPGNLAWGSRADNAADKRSHGTHANLQVKRCRKREHLLVEPNLEKWCRDNREGRKCYSCHWGLTISTLGRKRGHNLDPDVLAAQMYAFLMEGGPDPRRNRAMRRRADLVPSARDGLPDGRGVTTALSTTTVLRRTMQPGAEITVADALAQVTAAGVLTSKNGVSLALTRAVASGYFEKVQRGRYRRLREPVG